MEVFNLEEGDLVDVALLGKDMHAESPHFRELSYDPHAVMAWAMMHVRENHMAAWGVRNPRNQLVAAFFASVHPTFFGPALVAQEDAFFVAPKYRGSIVATKLMHTYLRWAEFHGAERATVSPNTGINEEQASSFFKKFGMEKVGVNMAKDFG